MRGASAGAGASALAGAVAPRCPSGTLDSALNPSRGRILRDRSEVVTIHDHARVEVQEVGLVVRADTARSGRLAHGGRRDAEHPSRVWAPSPLSKSPLDCHQHSCWVFEHVGAGCSDRRESGIQVRIEAPDVARELRLRDSMHVAFVLKNHAMTWPLKIGMERAQRRGHGLRNHRLGQPRASHHQAQERLGARPDSRSNQGNCPCEALGAGPAPHDVRPSAQQLGGLRRLASTHAGVQHRHEIVTRERPCQSCRSRDGR